MKAVLPTQRDAGEHWQQSACAAHEGGSAAGAEGGRLCGASPRAGLQMHFLRFNPSGVAGLHVQARRRRASNDRLPWRWFQWQFTPVSLAMHVLVICSLTSSSSGGSATSAKTASSFKLAAAAGGINKASGASKQATPAKIAVPGSDSGVCNDDAHWNMQQEQMEKKLEEMTFMRDVWQRRTLAAEALLAPARREVHLEAFVKSVKEEAELSASTSSSSSSDTAQQSWIAMVLTPHRDSLLCYVCTSILMLQGSLLLMFLTPFPPMHPGERRRDQQHRRYLRMLLASLMDTPFKQKVCGGGEAGVYSKLFHADISLCFMLIFYSFFVLCCTTTNCTNTTVFTGVAGHVDLLPAHVLLRQLHSASALC